VVSYFIRIFLIPSHLSPSRARSTYSRLCAGASGASCIAGLGARSESECSVHPGEPRAKTHSVSNGTTPYAVPDPPESTGRRVPHGSVPPYPYRFVKRTETHGVSEGACARAGVGVLRAKQSLRLLLCTPMLRESYHLHPRLSAWAAYRLHFLSASQARSQRISKSAAYSGWSVGQ
jgi:hypothetical protein